MPNFATAPTASGLVAVDGRTFPLRSARIEARAQGGLASSTLIQEYANPHTEPLEVLYTMPLPADGAVAGYAFTIGARTVTGTIERREEAQAAYREALMEGRTAGLLEQERADTFTQSLGNIPPGTGVTVRIEVHHPLAFLPAIGGAAAKWEWRFPTVVGVRYEGAEGRVPDADRLDVPRADGEGTPVRITAEVAVDDGRTLTAGPMPLDRDVVLAWDAGSDEVDARLVEGRGLDGDDGRYALLTITPPAEPHATLRRDLTILIDSSGSMEGAPIETAKSVAAALVDSLSEGDQLEILAFSDSVRDVSDGVVRAGSPAARAARERLFAMAASGGTEMVDAIRTALAPLRRDAQRQVVLLTDGYIGFEAEVASAIAKKVPDDSRVHVVGIGASPNRALTRAVARAGRGIEVLVGSGENPRPAAERLVRATAAPILTGLTIAGGAVKAVAPKRPRDVFAKEPVRLLLALDRSGGTVEVEARLAGSIAPWKRRFDVAREPSPATFVPPVGAFFGREHVEDLEAEIASGRHPYAEPIDLEIEAVGLKHRIVTRRTSLVAISSDPTVDPGDPRRRERLAVELPFGVSAEGVGLMGGYHVLSSESDFPLMDAIADDRRIFDHELPMETARRGSRYPYEPRTEMEGRVVTADDKTVVFELDVDDAPFNVPKDAFETVVMWSNGQMESCRVDASRGTRPGRYTSGMTVRIALVRPPGTRGSGKPLAVVLFVGRATTIHVTLR